MIASSSEIYGNPRVHPQTEDYEGSVNTSSIRACYNEGKRIAETLCFDFNRKFNLDIRIARIFNTYGPRMLADDGRVVSNFIVPALQGESLTVYGDRSQTRSFCYVDDLLEGMMGVMEQEKTVGPINLGNPTEFTIKELAQKILSMVNSSSTLVEKPLPSDDPTQRKPDISLAKEVLGWSPQVDLEKGLERTIPYFRALLES